MIKEYSRRSVLLAAAAAAGDLALNAAQKKARAGKPFIPESSTSSWNSEFSETISHEESPSVRERWVEKQAHLFKDRLRLNEALLRSGSPKKAYELAIQNQPEISEAVLRGTKFDITHLKRFFPFLFVVRPDGRGSKHIQIIPPFSEKDTVDRLLAGLDKTASYGNAIFTGRRTMLLPAHVAALAENDTESWRRKPSDIVFADVAPEFEVPLENCVDTGEMPSTKEIDGNLIVIIGADPDAEADPEGLKSFVRFGVTPRGAISKALESKDVDMKRLNAESVIVPLPRAAGVSRNDEITGRGVSRPISGTSGGYAFMWKEDPAHTDGRWVFIGHLWAASPARSGDRYAVGALNTSDALRDAYASDIQRIKFNIPMVALPGKAYGTRSWKERMERRNR